MAVTATESAIVVGTDGSATARAAVRRAIELAVERGATLHVVSAFRRDPTGGVAPEAAVYTEQFAARDAEAHVEEMAREAKASGVRVETYAIAGSAADALLEVAGTHDARCIVVGSRGMRGSRRFLGSVPNTVSHRAACDVLIVRTD